MAKTGKSFRLKISVVRLVPIDELDHDDRCDRPWGEYEYQVKASNVDDAKEQALSEFHGAVPIACLDDFDISVEVL
jgi:hypothetical protein